MQNAVTVTEDKEIEAPKKNLPASASDTKKLDDMLSNRGLSKQELQVLQRVVFPTAKATETVLLAVDYCRARKLDVMNKPVHIVPVWQDGQYVDTVWPSITLHRITAHRTGRFAGQDEAKFGPEKTETWKASKGKKGQEKIVDVTVTYPEWCQITVYKILEGQKCSFPGPKLHWKEAYKTIRHDSDCPNDRWEKAPSAQLEKCAEAAALRRAFPEECGSETAEEMDGEVLHGSADENGKVTIKAIQNSAADLAEEIAAEVTGEVVGEVEPTSQEKLQAHAEIAKQLGDLKAAESLEAAAKAGLTSSQAVTLNKTARTNGWSIPQVLDEIAAQYNISRTNWQKEMSERQWREMCDFLETNKPGE